MVVPGGWSRRGVPPVVIVVARKWPTGDVGDERWSAVSESDRAALEVGLRLAEASGDSVTVVTVGGSGADPSLREALAVGAVRAVRIDSSADLRSDAVAWAIAEVARDARWVVCGDASSDRGSGAVPAFLAAELGAAQALGLVTVEADRGDGGPPLVAEHPLAGDDDHDRRNTTPCPPSGYDHEIAPSSLHTR